LIGITLRFALPWGGRKKGECLTKTCSIIRHLRERSGNKLTQASKGKKKKKKGGRGKRGVSEPRHCCKKGARKRPGRWRRERRRLANKVFCVVSALSRIFAGGKRGEKGKEERKAFHKTRMVESGVLISIVAISCQRPAVSLAQINDVFRIAKKGEEERER